MRLLFCSLAFLLATVVADETVTTPATPCVHVPASNCPSVSQGPRLCETVDNAVLCCHITNEFQLMEGLGVQLSDTGVEIRSLHIFNASLPDLHLNNFTRLFSSLEELAVTDGFIVNITGSFPAGIVCLNLSNNGLQRIEHASLAALHNLANLDVARNNLTQLPEIHSRLHDVWLDIAGTNNLPCTNITDIINAMKKMNRTLHFAHDNDTICFLRHNYNWFNSTERIPLMQVDTFSKLKEDCPHGCMCNVQRLNIVIDQPPTITVKVDCSGLQLTDLPENLPPYTVSLNVSNNNISSLSRLANDSSYHHLREFYADSNQIKNIIELEGSKFIGGFDFLTLRGNAIRIIPTYILSNTFDEHSGSIVKLGLNRLTCDCNAALVTKVWLMTNQKYVTDYDEVMCDNSPGRLIELDKNTVCTEERVWTDYIYYIIAAEVALLFLLVAKVTYDYWVFKTAGYLPWPASKMPKLPCDWFFET